VGQKNGVGPWRGSRRLLRRRLELLEVRLFRGSSAVEQPAVNRLVVGSNPTRGANIFGSGLGRMWPPETDFPRSDRSFIARHPRCRPRRQSRGSHLPIEQAGHERRRSSCKLRPMHGSLPSSAEAESVTHVSGTIWTALPSGSSSSRGFARDFERRRPGGPRRAAGGPSKRRAFSHARTLPSRVLAPPACYRRRRNVVTLVFGMICPLDVSGRSGFVRPTVHGHRRRPTADRSRNPQSGSAPAVLGSRPGHPRSTKSHRPHRSSCPRAGRPLGSIAQFVSLLCAQAGQE
jgi:hypothetical protein